MIKLSNHYFTTACVQITMALVLGAGLFTHTVQAADAPKEYLLKAAFIYQFAKFVKWPDGLGNDLTIGVYDPDPFQGAMDTIVGKTSQGKTVVVKTISKVDELRNCCQIVFFSKANQNQAQQLMHALEGVPVLTTGEYEGFANQGGMIGFVQKGAKLKFEVNLQAAQSAGIKLSSQLIDLGIVVKE